MQMGFEQEKALQSEHQFGSQAIAICLLTNPTCDCWVAYACLQMQWISQQQRSLFSCLSAADGG